MLNGVDEAVSLGVDIGGACTLVRGIDSGDCLCTGLGGARTLEDVVELGAE